MFGEGIDKLFGIVLGVISARQLSPVRNKNTTMNIEEAEELLNATKLHLEWRQSDLQELHIKQAKLDNKKQELQEQIAYYRETAEHLTNVIEMMKLKASIPVLNY